MGVVLTLKDPEQRQNPRKSEGGEDREYFIEERTQSQFYSVSERVDSGQREAPARDLQWAFLGHLNALRVWAYRSCMKKAYFLRIRIGNREICSYGSGKRDTMSWI